ncbi:MAG: hypothetical protein J5636_10780 [Clostridiales bacterium]|nr:hypothetical protein [Clostridiales bacterium]
MFLSLFVQVISLVVSFILNLIVPKFIPELSYAHWQTFVLYAGYVGVLHFGLLDGLVLRYSQYDYDQLDKPRIRSQFRALLLGNSFITFTTMLFVGIFVGGANKLIFILVALSVLSRNLFTYTSYIFQITNRIKIYAKLVISQRLFFGVFTVVLLLLHVENFYMYCIADLCADFFGVLVGFFYNKDMYIGKAIPLTESMKELKSNISSGCMLLVANWSSALLISGAKMIIQWHWGDLIFGKVSFSFSISNLFLAFVTAISVVLFPQLKRMEKDKLPQLYMTIRNAVTPVLFISLLCYYPGCLVLERWLPKYVESLTYLGIMLPIIIYASKVSLLTNNYLKAYRAEKKMLIVNVIAVVSSMTAFLISAYVLDNMNLMLYFIVFFIMMRSVLSEIIVAGIIHVNIKKDFIIEGFMTMAFILCAKHMKFVTGCLVYAALLVLYLYMYKDSLKQFIRVKPKKAE